MSTSRRLRALVTGVLLALVVGGCGLAGDGDPPARAEPAAPYGGPGPDASGAMARLDDLVVLDRPRGTAGYRREAFGSAWADTDDNGCNQRDDVLLRDAVPGTTRVQQQDACDHDVLAGTWVDPYTGARLVLDDLKDATQAQAVQIDHVVPLAEAWVSGAAGWGEARRASYANDLEGLLAVDGPTNASKGAGDPAAWRPRQAEQCAYAVRWVDGKHRWGLAVDAPEVRALREMLETCPVGDDPGG